MARRLEHRLHHQAGAEDKTVELVDIGREVGDRPRRHAGFASGFRHRRRDAQDEARVEGRGDQEIRAEHRCLAGIGARRDVRRLLAGKGRDCPHGGHLHLLVDGAGAAVQRPAEDVRKAEHVVDLIGKIGTPGADHRVWAGGARHFRHDLRRRVGERQDQRFRRHVLQEFGLKHAGGGEAEEHIGARDDIGQRARFRILHIRVFPAIHLLGAAHPGDAETVGDPDVFDLGAERDQKIKTGKCRGACAGSDDLDVGDRSGCRSTIHQGPLMPVTRPADQSLGGPLAVQRNRLRDDP